MNKILFLFLMPCVLWGFTYDVAVLQIGTKIFPKVALMEQGTKERIQSNVNFVIVASPPYKEPAQQLLMMFERQYGGVFGNYTIALKIVSPKEALEINNSHGYFVFMDPEDTLLLPLVEHAHKSKTLTFCFDAALLQKGCDVSLYIGRSVKPYINLTTLKQVPFTFEYGFLKLSQPY
ncbi:hypothetical protein [Sulfuricurvum sp.]|uniref:hypothetical protein n=1 Tax=Sulfuricurvum sp. TaxID=2025608 RepID=UPI002D693BE8|nr:hypothetical protein [Sulfuricurvum sp.]HZF70343.1 hypothetical protein [Sulfuricurvum sp.]